jgi:hypothetical protein
MAVEILLLVICQAQTRAASAQDVDAAAALNGSAMWGIFLQAEMGPCRVVIRSVFLQDAPKMSLAPHHHVVKTLTSDRADCALDISVLPWRSRRDRVRMPIDRTRRVNTSP